ncbi:MAG: hypothetical protein ACRD1T_21910, partial [Acidimicrobiia bacterium]
MRIGFAINDYMKKRPTLRDVGRPMPPVDAVRNIELHEVPSILSKALFGLLHEPEGAYLEAIWKQQRQLRVALAFENGKRRRQTERLFAARI